jgi:hypothetical protein
MTPFTFSRLNCARAASENFTKITFGSGACAKVVTGNPDNITAVITRLESANRLIDLPVPKSRIMTEPSYLIR